MNNINIHDRQGLTRGSDDTLAGQSPTDKRGGVRLPTKLVATWISEQDSSVDDPSTVVWEGGTQGTLQDFRAHGLDTHFWYTDERGCVQKHMFPYIVGEVSYEKNVEDWVVRGRDVVTTALNLKDPKAVDIHILAFLFTLPIYYKSQIIRQVAPGLSIAAKDSLKNK
jgi:hypothetical protein